MRKFISIQTSNTLTGEYDVHKPWPYPYHIDAETFEVGRQDFWRGDPLALVGFQKNADRHRVDLWPNDWQTDPEQAVGMFPVFRTSGEGFYSLMTPVVEVTEYEISEGEL